MFSPATQTHDHFVEEDEAKEEEENNETNALTYQRISNVYTAKIRELYIYTMVKTGVDVY